MLRFKTNKEKEFQKLIDSVLDCRLCERLSSRNKILSRLNGNIYSKILIIAEAPGRLGADKFNIPLFGDQTGKAFQRLLDNIGITRREIFITNAVLCNPRNLNGKNVPPQKSEIENCSIYLNMLINLIQPEYVVTFGVKALEALKMIKPHNYELKNNIRQFLPWYNRKLIPLYHTSPRTLAIRSFNEQLEDFKKVFTKIFPEKKMRKIQFRAAQRILFPELYSKLEHLICYIVNRMKIVSEFKLSKLIYLIDYKCWKTAKKTITGEYYMRVQDGPIQANLRKSLNQLKGQYIELKFYKNKPYIFQREIIDLCFRKYFTLSQRKVIDKILNNYKNYSDRQIKTKVYLTKAMRNILKEERGIGQKIGSPIFKYK